MDGSNAAHARLAPTAFAFRLPRRILWPERNRFRDGKNHRSNPFFFKTRRDEPIGIEPTSDLVNPTEDHPFQFVAKSVGAFRDVGPAEATDRKHRKAMDGGQGTGIGPIDAAVASKDDAGVARGGPDAAHDSR